MSIDKAKGLPYHQAFKALYDMLDSILKKLDNTSDPQTVEIIASIVLTVAQQSIERTLQERGTIVSFSEAPTAAGSTSIVTPSAGKKIKVLMWFYYCLDDISTELAFSTSGIYVAGLPRKGCCGLNTIGRTPPQGAADEPLTLIYSGAGTIRGWICIEEV